MLAQVHHESVAAVRGNLAKASGRVVADARKTRTQTTPQVNAETSK
jgi:hypothetical protein